MKIKIECVREGAKVPKYGKDMDVGADCYLPEDITLLPGMNKIPLGISIAIPHGFEGQIRPRSGTLLRGITIHNPPIDPGYTGEIHAMVENITDHTMRIEKGERICQLVVTPFVRADFVNEIINNRGDSGFNSTGR